jgi:hypothetical protein
MPARLSCKVKRYRGIGSLSRAALAAALTACTTPPQNAPGGAAVSQKVERSEQCSTLGVLACKAMALLSSDTVPTCSLSSGREICGYAPAPAKTVESPPAGANTYPVRLAWTDNSDNESAFVIERCDQISVVPAEKPTPSCAGAWRQIATVAANTTSYVDNTASPNQTYMYRVKAINSKGSSGYTAEALITTGSR